MPLKHIVSQYATGSNIANLGWLDFKNKDKGFICMGAAYQRDRRLYSISSANMKTFLLHMITHIP